MKPHIRLRVVGEKKDKLEEARRKFGSPFAHEQGTRWKPRAVPVLTEWLQRRGRHVEP